MKALLVFGVLALAACGADGRPERPGASATGLTVSGEIKVGVTGGG